MYDLSSTKLLIVEDGAEHRDILQRRLANVVASITIATNKMDALQLLKEHYFHIALLDIKLDGEADSDNQDGMEIAKAIHASGDETSVIMLTGFGTVQRTRDAMIEYGVVDFLEKASFTKEKLLAAVEKAAQKEADKKAQKVKVGSQEKHAFISSESLDKVKAALKFEQLESFLGLLEDLLHSLVPLVANPSAFEQVVKADAGIYFTSNYWSRIKGKGLQVTVGSRDLVREQAQAHENEPDFMMRNRQTIAGFRYIDHNLTLDKFS